MITLDEPMVDWITLTTFSHHIGEWWAANLRKNAMGAIKVLSGVRRLQYKGDVLEDSEGSIFVGKGKQGRASHYMATVSGLLADRVMEGGIKTKYGFLVRDGGGEWLGDVNCTRIDVQVTCLDKSIQGEGGGSLEYQKKVFDSIQGAGRAVSWFQDGSGENAVVTVAVNSRKSDVYYRIYPKPTNEGHAMRFEVEYKKEKAARVFASICSGGRQKMGEILKYQVMQLNSAELKALVLGALEGYSASFPKKQVGDGATNTELWLLTVVLPSLVRTLKTSDRAGIVWAAFGDALGAYDNEAVYEVDWEEVVDKLEAD